MEYVCLQCADNMPVGPPRITQNSLVNAAANGHDKCVEELIQLGARVNRLDNKRNSALMVAVEKGHETCTDLLIGAGADVNLTEYSNGSAALHRAAAKGQTKCLEKLIEAGAAVNLAGTGGLTAFNFATENNHQDCFEKLMEAGADVNLSGRNGCTPLHKAAENRCKKYLEKLIQNNANVHAVDTNGQTALLKAANRNLIEKDNIETDTQTQSLECIQILLKAGADVNIADNSGHTPLSRSAECGDQKAMEILLQNGACINVVDAKGNTPLMKTVQKKHMNCLVYLINQGADVNIANENCMTPLVVASGFYPSAVVLLIDKGANVNVKTSAGKTPLFYFASNVNDNEFEIGKVSLDLLITAGADVNLADGESGTALMSTIKYDNKKTFTYLLEKGANTNAVSRDNGRTAMHYAARYSKLDYIQYLILYGANVNLADNNGRTAMHYAAQNSKLDYIHYLVLHGADVNLADHNGETPLLMVACYPKYCDPKRTINCVKFLLKMGADVNYLSNKGISATGGLLTVDKRASEDISEAMKVLYAAGEIHKNVIVDCNEKLIVLQHPFRRLLDSRLINLVKIYSSLFGNRKEILPLNATQFRHYPESPLDMSLMNFCRVAIRNHLFQVNRKKNLFGIVPKLPIPSLMKEYLLYGVSLDF